MAVGLSKSLNLMGKVMEWKELELWSAINLVSSLPFVLPDVLILINSYHAFSLPKVPPHILSVIIPIFFSVGETGSERLSLLPNVTNIIGSSCSLAPKPMLLTIMLYSL